MSSRDSSKFMSISRDGFVEVEGVVTIVVESCRESLRIVFDCAELALT